MTASNRSSGVLAALLLAVALPSTAPTARQGTVSFPTDDGGTMWADVYGEGSRREPGPSSAPQAPDVPEAGSIEAIARETSEPRFLSPWVSYVPESEAVPSPADVLGHVAGAAGELPGSAAVYGYMRRLAEASERVHVEVIGTSEEGREILLVAIADEEGIRRLPGLKAASAALADPRVTAPDEVEEVVAGARPFYFLNGAIHADESVAPDMLMELAYRLAVSEQPFIRGIRQETVVLINPVANPDGRDKMAEWFRRHHRGRGIDDYGELPRQSPPYWGEYVFVDANRDAHQLELATTQAVARMFFEYHPVVIHDLHEAIPLLLTWNGTGPYNPNLDPIVWSEFLEMSFHEMSTLSAMGMPGVWTWNFGEGFGHHYTDSIAMNHNAIGRGYETFGNGVPLALTRDLEGRSTTREWYRPIPPPAEPFTWSHRDGLNYSQTAALSALDYTARNAKQLLRAFWAKGRNSWQRGVAGDPYAFAIPAEQGDRRRVARMIGRLEKQGIEVHRAAEDFEVAEGSFYAGDFVVRLDQPYRNYAVDLLLPQEFPEDAEYEPYDDTSWAFPVHFGVEAARVDDAAILDVALEPVEGTPDVTGRVFGWGEASGSGGGGGPGSPAGGAADGSGGAAGSGDAGGAGPGAGATGAAASGQEGELGPAFLLRDTGQEALLAARYRVAEFDVSIAEEPFFVERRRAGAGSWILPPQEGLRPAVERVAEELALDFEILESVPASREPRRHAAPAPRIGVWVPWADTDMIGWIRLILDREGIPYTYLRDEDIRAGGLGERVDVIVYGTVLLDLAAQIHGIDPDDGPLAFTATDEYPSLGTPAASEDITGGVGWEGLAELEAFVRAGGLLVTLGNGSTLALEGGLIRHVARADLPDTTTPGVHMRAEFLQPGHPVAYGYPRITVAFRSPYPLYDPPRSWLTMSYCTSCLDGPVDLEHVVMQWGTRPFVPSATSAEDAAAEPGSPPSATDAPAPEEGLPLVVSGGGRNTDAAQGRPAILDVPLGDGRIVAFNFNPMHRDMNRADHRYLWNVLLNWESIVSGR